MTASFILALLLSQQELPSQTYSALTDKAYTLYGEGKFSEAADSFKKALDLFPEDGQVWMTYAQACLRADRTAEGIAAGTKVIELGSFGAKVKATAYFEIAAGYCKLKDEKNAWKNLELAMQAGFRDLKTVQTDSRLELLHSNPKWEDLAATKDVTKMTRDEGWRYDTWLLDRELRRIHFNPYIRVTPEQRDGWIRIINSGIPNWSDEKIQVELMKYVASFGDGHTNIRIPSLQRPKIQLFWFKEGIYVTATAPEHKDILGAKIIAVEGKPVEELATLAEPLICHENPQLIKAQVPNVITNTTVLKGLGLNPKSGEVNLTVETVSGDKASVALPLSADFQVKPDWALLSTNSQILTLKNRVDPYWFEHIPELNAVYFQYNSVRSNPQNPLPQFAESMYKFIDENKIQRLIIDVRWNGGGNTFLSKPFIDGLLERRSLKSSPNLFVIIGRNTYSAAQNFTTDIGRACQPIYVGEPTGSSPNFIGESIPYSLPYSKMSGTVSDLYWQRSWPMDDRIWIAPDLPATPSFQAFANGKDPAMEAIKAFIQSSEKSEK
ncbi:MAG: hypothetical protein KF824_07335 [Fimbriimonadaceae bacterium]|nr:MAG: hypothetical protein KF824_07335 [Fimbriimonadaceae bacterium]